MIHHKYFLLKLSFIVLNGSESVPTVQVFLQYQLFCLLESLPSTVLLPYRDSYALGVGGEDMCHCDGISFSVLNIQ